MKNIYKSIFILVLGLNLAHSKHSLSQKHLLSILPNPTTDSVKENSQFSFTFDNKIIEDSIKTHTITIKKKKSKKQGIVGAIEIQENILIFKPSKLLEIGTYHIKVNPIKLEREIQDNTKKRPHPIHTKAIRFKFKVTEDTVTLVALTANPNTIALSEHNSTTLAVLAKYADNSTLDVTQKATYSSSDNVVDVEKGVISSNDSGTATITIGYEDKTTTVQVEVYETIEGHRLPPEPQNPDATLLGVDVNDNGVRDEVERWIYKEMPTYHHPEIERVIAMQQAKADQMALVDPTNKEDNVLDAIHRADDCWWYYEHIKNIDDSSVEAFNIKLRDKSFNTKNRLNTYFEYDYSLRGRSFIVTGEKSTDCDININVIK
ncbi:MAG: hypothetical protein Q9M36_02240 [Sulfurovum sp.]|nr:hypothetical protein [Sulfurovum sp.]